MGENRVYNSHSFSQDPMVPESQNSIPILLKKCGPFGIRLHLLDMLASIHLDNQLFFNTNEIYDKWADRMLATKFPSGEISIAQLIP
jgi:hypothetical protein